MNKNEIVSYLKSQVPPFNSKNNKEKHILQFDLYVHPFLNSGKNTYFIDQFTETLEFIDNHVIGYSKIMIDIIASCPKNKPEQFFQRVTEVYVLYNLLNIDGVDQSSVELEPRGNKNGKNPEYRMKINDEWYAFEVKTPDIKTLKNRQNGVQVTTRLNEEEKNIIKKYKPISYTKDLKIKDYIENANKKFSEYKITDEYNNDIKVLVIVWDDFINEAVSALINPNAGILTEKSFAPEIEFENIDGILISRFLTPLVRLFYFGESLKEDNGQILNLFKAENITTGLSIGINKKFNPYLFLKYFMNYTDDIPPAEYHPTDLIDWDSCIGLKGLNNCPNNIRLSLLKYLMKLGMKKDLYSYNYINFVSVNIDKIWDKSKKDNENLNEIRKVIQTVKNISYDNIHRNEIDMATYRNGSHSYKELIETEYATLIGSNKICKCNSGNKFSECCEVNLKYYEYVDFYKR